MQDWDEYSEKVTKITPDREKATALLKLVELREEDIATKSEKFATIIVEELYEIIKELITGLLAIEGWKTVSHELLVGYLAHFYKQHFSMSEILLIDQLRKIRNDIDYRGVMVNVDYLHRNKEPIMMIINRLKQILQTKLR